MDAVVDAVYKHELTRNEVKEYIKTLNETHATGYFYEVLKNYASSQPPDPSGIPDEDELASAARRCVGMKSFDAVYKRLSRFYNPDTKTTKCLYCACNQVCMVRGCDRRPLDSATERNATSHRCGPGCHLCSKHGQPIMVNRTTCSTVTTLLLDDGRTVSNVWASQGGNITRKRERAHEDTRVRFKKRRAEAQTRLSKYVDKLQIQERPAKEGIDVLIDFLITQLKE